MKLSKTFIFCTSLVLFEFIFEFPIKAYFLLSQTETPRIMPLFNGPESQSPRWWLFIHLMFAVVNLLLFIAKNCNVEIKKKYLVLSHVTFSLLLLPNASTLMSLSSTIALGVNLGAIVLLSILLYFDRYLAYLSLFSLPVLMNPIIFLKWVVRHNQWFYGGVCSVCLAGFFTLVFWICHQAFPTKKEA